MVAAVAALVVPSIAYAELADEQALAERFAPVVRLVEQVEECGPGEPYEPRTSTFSSTSRRSRCAGLGTDGSGEDRSYRRRPRPGRYEYHLDFPGDALDPGCDYERWARRITEGSAPTVVRPRRRPTDRPGEFALQYWLFYPFNDFNNLHEGDWEMIQLVFAARDAREALGREPESVGYSSHEGAERAEWGDDKLEVVGGTHPVVYPAAGSHANKFTEALYLGSSAEAGCRL